MAKKAGIPISCATGAVLRTKNGGFINQMEKHNSELAYTACSLHHGEVFVRQQTRQCHLEQLRRFRFRHQLLEYLVSLEKRWEQAIGTGVLPPWFEKPCV